MPAPPLTAEQTSALARTFSLESLARASNSPMGESDPVTGINLSQKVIPEQAAQVLPPAQAETLRKIFLNDNQLGALMNAFQAANPAYTTGL